MKTTFFKIPFPCQLSINLICYACLPENPVNFTLPESTTQLVAGQFQPCHEQVFPVSEHCLLHRWHPPNSHYMETATNTHTHTHTHTYTHTHTHNHCHCYICLLHYIMSITIISIITFVIY